MHHAEIINYPRAMDPQGPTFGTEQAIEKNKPEEICLILISIAAHVIK